MGNSPRSAEAGAWGVQRSEQESLAGQGQGQPAPSVPFDGEAMGTIEGIQAREDDGVAFSLG